MSDLIEKLRAAIDEDERLARSATWSNAPDAAAWTFEDAQAPYERAVVADGLGDGVVIVQPENADVRAVGKHVARHDPARVLAMVAAHREILEEHKPSTRRAGWDRDETICGTCSYDSGTDDYAFPCPTMRALAKGYGIEW